MLLKNLALMSLAIVISATISATSALAQTPEPTDVDGNITWVYSYEDGKALSEKTKKPMFVVFRCER